MKKSLIKFIGIKIADISRMQGFSMAQQWDKNRKILRKYPNNLNKDVNELSDKELKHIGGMLSKYVIMLANPTKYDIERIKRNYQIELKKEDFFGNLLKMKNSETK